MASLLDRNEDQADEFSIYWSDLNPDTQKRLLEAFNIESPKEMNWDADIFPVATIVKGEDLDDEIFNGMYEESKLDQHLSQP